jgi:hypothetical protein
MSLSRKPMAAAATYPLPELAAAGVAGNRTGGFCMASVTGTGAAAAGGACQ